MTVLDHPERARAQARGDLAARMVPLAGELAFLVRTEDRESIGTWLDAHGIPDHAETRALLIVLAGLSSIDTTPEEQLAWVTWDEFGAALSKPASVPVLPPGIAPEGEHGTIQAYWRHFARGEEDQLGLHRCGCAQAFVEYEADRLRQRRAAAEASADAQEAGHDEQLRIYARLRGEMRMKIVEAAAFMGKSKTTAKRFERELREAGRAPWNPRNQEAAGDQEEAADAA